MVLFGAEKVSHGSAPEAIQMIRQYFSHRGLNPDKHKVTDADDYGYWLTEGSAKIYIFVQESSQDAVLRITSPLVCLPEDKSKLEPLYRHLLDLNSSMTNCALATHQNLVLIVAQRPTRGLTQEELDNLVWHIAYVADMFDNQLAEQYSCQLYRE
ncbi:YbjN domain-containing protein [bacterium]|nr:YbjN domain-containing protein [bacterium]